MLKVVLINVLLPDLACAVVPLIKNSYSTPPEPIKETLSPAHMLMVAAAVIAPGFAVNPGVGKAFTVTSISFDATSHCTPLSVFTTKRR